MSDYLQRYLPEYDEESERQKLAGFAKPELLDLLIQAYKEKRVLAKLLDEMYTKQNRMRQLLDEPSKLGSMPDIPGPDELRKLME